MARALENGLLNKRQANNNSTSSFFEISPVMFRKLPCTIPSDLTRTV